MENQAVYIQLIEQYRRHFGRDPEAVADNPIESFRVARRCPADAIRRVGNNDRAVSGWNQRQKPFAIAV